jgi:predicted metalloprotease with PDZ domain
MALSNFLGNTQMVQKILIALYLMYVAQPAFAAGRGYLGVWFGMIPAKDKAVSTGVIVNKAFAGMAAEQAGLKPGEIVTEINGISVPDPKTAVALLAENTAGERIRLTVIDRTNGGLRRSYVFATMGANPTGDFAKIMTVKARPRPVLPSTTSRHCAGSAKTRDRPCRADTAKER